MKKILIGILLTSASYSYAQTINAEQIKKDNVTIKGNAAHQLRADTSFLATRYYVDSVAGGASFDTTSMSNRINLKVDSVKRKAGTDSVFYYNSNGTPYFAFIDSVSGATIAAAAWALLGNAGTSSTTNFVGTTDNVSVAFRVNNNEIMRLNKNGSMLLRMRPDTLSYDSTAINSAQFTTPSLAIGDSAMETANITGPHWRIPWNNVAIGYWAGRDLFGGWANTFVGTGAGTYTIGLWSDTTLPAPSPYNVGGYENVCIGYGAGHLNRMGYENTFIGTGAGYGGWATKDNVCVGVGTGSKNQANNNTFVGTFSGLNCVSSGANTFIGSDAGRSTVSGQGNNVYIGGGAGVAATTAFSSTIVGALAGVATNGVGQVFLGYQAGIGCTSGQENLIIGEVGGDNLTTQSHNVFIGKGYVQGTYALDTTHTWMWGVDVQNRASNYIRLNANTTLNYGGTNAGGSRLYALDAGGMMKWTALVNDTTSGDAATINSVTGRFKKDDSGSTFTLTNSFITTNSAITLTANNAAIDATATSWTYFVGAPGVATIVFNSAPTADFKMIFKVEN